MKKILLQLIIFAFAHSAKAQCWQSISCGVAHSMAIKVDGTLWAWGFNVLGQLGDGTTINKNIPTPIGTATNWQTVSAQRYYTMAIKTDGTLWAWGVNSNGQLGDGTNINKNIPTQIGTATNWQKINSAGFHNLALKTDGTLWAWGLNGFGKVCWYNHNSDENESTRTFFNHDNRKIQYFSSSF